MFKQRLIIIDSYDLILFDVCTNLPVIQLIVLIDPESARKKDSC